MVTVRKLIRSALKMAEYNASAWYFYLRVSEVIATATWLGGWLAGWLDVCLSQPVLYQND